MREVVGLDSGARRLAVYFCDQERFAWYETPPSNTRDELNDLAYWLTEVCGLDYDKHDVWLEKVVIPHGTGGSNPDTFLRHAMTIGMVIATVGGEIITPATWKATVPGHGHADKRATAEWVRASSPSAAAAVEASATTQDRRADLFDAYCIAAHGDLARRHPDGLDPAGGVPKRTHRRRAR